MFLLNFHRKKTCVLLLITGMIAAAFRSTGGMDFPVPKGWPQPVYNFRSNPLSPDKIALGQALFYDPILSRDGTISCASCHSPYNSFAHADHSLSHGIGGRMGTRNAPALMNLAWQRSFMWDGAISRLDLQSLTPIGHPDEMGDTVQTVLARLQGSALYRGLFYKAYGDSAVTRDHFLKAITQFMLTLVSAGAKYDQVMGGGDTFTAQERRGYALFRQDCASCHREPLFTTGAFANNGLRPDTSLHDYGRASVTHRAADSFLYKIPTLRNVEYSYPYMHDGRFKKLSEVVKHYSAGLYRSTTLAPELRRVIVLSANDQVDLVAFLLTLSDKKFVFNPAYGYPKAIFFPPARD